MGSSGCLLPLLIIINLFFGRRIFNSVGLWLGAGVILALIFMFKIRLMVFRISQQFGIKGSGSASPGQGRKLNRAHNQSYKPLGKIIDIQGQEVNDEQEIR